MDIAVEPGRYVVAVSGGVDSMVLLDLLAKQADSRPLVTAGRGHQSSAMSYELVVAHFDHGIRPDSQSDRELVQAVSERYKLPFVYKEGHLGPQASEEKAREARYAFLEAVRQRYEAEAIITAHHQDDVLETAILNMLRGTGRKGLTSLANRPGIIRPLLSIPQKDILSYAERHKIAWHEDSTNIDEAYLRNYIRQKLLPRFDADARRKFIEIIEQARLTNEALDAQLVDMLHVQPRPGELERAYFNQLPHDVAKEFLAGWLRSQGVRGFTSQTLERATIAVKIQRPGAIIDIIGGTALRVTKNSLALVELER